KKQRTCRKSAPWTGAFFSGTLRTMPDPFLVRRDSYPRSLWRNGLGHTDQIAIEPPTAKLAAGDYLWRISTAQIARGSEFSLFPEHDRILVILAGAGVR